MVRGSLVSLLHWPVGSFGSVAWRFRFGLLDYFDVSVARWFVWFNGLVVRGDRGMWGWFVAHWFCG